MSTLREAAQQALEALEMSRRFVYADNRPQCDEAITTLRAALAQQDEPVQEPVAWLYEAGTDRTLHWHKPPLYGTPLYTAPPKRQPLTQEESDNIYREFMLYQDRLTPSVLQRVVRAIERAHGIIESEIKVDSHQTLDDAMQQPRAMAQAYESGYNAGVANEREACAKVCESRFMGDLTREDMEARRCAAAIRARGNT